MIYAKTLKLVVSPCQYRKMLFYAFHSDNVTPSRFIELASFKGLPVNSQFLLYQFALKHEELNIGTQSFLSKLPGYFLTYESMAVRKSVSDMLCGSPDFRYMYACIAYAESCKKIPILGPIFREILVKNQAKPHTFHLLK